MKKRPPRKSKAKAKGYPADMLIDWCEKYGVEDARVMYEVWSRGVDLADVNRVAEAMSTARSKAWARKKVALMMEATKADIDAPDWLLDFAVQRNLPPERLRQLAKAAKPVSALEKEDKAE
jgi:hypothetical protein